MKIQLRGKSVHIIYSGDGMDVSRSMVHRIRRELELDDDHGCDSFIFYRAEERMPVFIRRYQKAISRLAYA